jgi:hypothetical protein
MAGDKHKKKEEKKREYGRKHWWKDEKEAGESRNLIIVQNALADFSARVMREIFFYTIHQQQEFTTDSSCHYIQYLYMQMGSFKRLW